MLASESRLICFEYVQPDRNTARGSTRPCDPFYETIAQPNHDNDVVSHERPGKTDRGFVVGARLPLFTDQLLIFGMKCEPVAGHGSPPRLERLPFGIFLTKLVEKLWNLKRG